MLNVGVSVQAPSQVHEPPVPAPFAGKEPPALEPTDAAGLFMAPSLAPNVYYHDREDLWYRYAYRRWYQAFRWNGNWFILGEEPPEILSGRKLMRPELPELPD